MTTTKVSAIEVFQLRGNTTPPATVTFEVYNGTGVDENGSPSSDYDEVLISSDQGELPVGGLLMARKPSTYLFAWTKCDLFESNRYQARHVYDRLLACAYSVIPVQ